MNRFGFDEESSVKTESKNLTFQASIVFFYFFKYTPSTAFSVSLRDQLVSDIPKRVAIFITKGMCSFPPSSSFYTHWVEHTLFPTGLNLKHKHYFLSYLFMIYTYTITKFPFSIYLHHSPDFPFTTSVSGLFSASHALCDSLVSLVVFGLVGFCFRLS